MTPTFQAPRLANVWMTALFCLLSSCQDTFDIPVLDFRRFIKHSLFSQTSSHPHIPLVFKSKRWGGLKSSWPSVSSPDTRWCNCLGASIWLQLLFPGLVLTAGRHSEWCQALRWSFTDIFEASQWMIFNNNVMVTLLICMDADACAHRHKHMHAVTHTWT